MTNEQLEEAVARIFEVDAKRTQGEWLLEIGEDGELTLWLGSSITERESGVYDTAGEIKLYDFPEPDAECNSNAVFIEASPLMAQVIRQLWAERERQRAVMAQAKAAIDDLRGTIDRDGIGAWSSQSPQAIAAMQAIAALESMGV